MSVVVGLHWNFLATTELGFFRKLWLTFLQECCSRFVMVSTQSFDDPCDIGSSTHQLLASHCHKQTVRTREMVHTRGGFVKRATRFNAVPLCSFVSGTLADSSCTSQDRVVTNGLTMHDNSFGVPPHVVSTWTRKLPTWKHRS